MPTTIDLAVADAVHELCLGPQDCLVVGLSGGVDSQVLTASLAALHRRGDGPRLLAVHVNHQLRPEAASDAAQVVALAGRLGVPVEVATVDVGAWDKQLREGVESAARAARYAALAAAARAHGTRWVAVGHTLDDQAETVLLRLARGGRLEGLGGMRPVSRREIPLRPEGDDRYTLEIVRPLLGVRRADIERYAQAHGLTPVEDRSNLSLIYRRNIVRHQVLPLLEQVAPGAAMSIARTAERLQDDTDVLNELADAAAARVLGQTEQVVTVDRAGLRALAPALQRRVLIEAVSRAAAGEARFTLERIEALRSAVLDGRVSSTIDVGAGISAYIDYDQAAIGPAEQLEPALRRASTMPTLEPDTATPIDGTVRLELGDGWHLSVSVTGLGWALRTRRPGDRVRTEGGRLVRLQDWFVNRKIPAYLRDHLPLVAREDEVYWVGGVSPARFQVVDEGLEVVLSRHVGRGKRVTEQLRDIALHQELDRVLIDEETLQARIAELGKEIAGWYGEKRPVLIGVLTGAFMFMADLSRAMEMPLEVEFMAVSSYGMATTTSGVVQILKDLKRPIEGQHVLVVEDIIDSGLTLQYLLDVLERRNPADIRVVALLRKDRARELTIRADWVGFEIPDEFVVGYGLDMAEQYRNLPFIGVVRTGDDPE